MYKTKLSTHYFLNYVIRFLQYTNVFRFVIIIFMRTHLWFYVIVLIWLNLQCTEFDFEYGTECLHLAQKYAKTSASLIDGPDSLWKVGVSAPYI